MSLFCASKLSYQARQLQACHLPFANPIFSHKNVLTIQLSELKKIKDVFFFGGGDLQMSS